MKCRRSSTMNSGMVIPAHVNVVDGVSDKVKGMTKVPVGEMGGSECPEFAWLD